MRCPRGERIPKPMRAQGSVRAGRRAVTGRADRWIRRTTAGCVGMLALISGTVSYLHMHLLVELHGQPGWVAALTPLSVDGMIVAASTTLLAESRSGNQGGALPWALLVVGSVASLAANASPASAGEPTRPCRATPQLRTAVRDLRLDAWRWAQDNRAADGSLPSGRAIGTQYGRHERWGRMVKRSGLAGEIPT